MLDTIIYIALLLFCYACIGFVVGMLLKRNDVADIGWGLGFILICAYVWITQPITPLSALVYVLVTLWGLRLSLHIALRSRGKAEDFRYRQWREAWGRWFVLRSFLQVYVLQCCFMLIMSVPIIIAAKASYSHIYPLSFAGVLLWLIGFFFEVVGDYQLSIFIKHKSRKDEVIQTGLWRYTRHPNYFGEVTLWWGVFFIVLPVQYGIWGIISPITITYLLLYVSGIPMLEAKYTNNQEFQAYKKRTSAFLPWWPSA
ncbi:MAG TPA: steroid 5-alpha reductase [Saprospirales bacterium]|nr:steroid 5-alpha reductase [Saprospirales bacterium]